MNETFVPTLLYANADYGDSQVGSTSEPPKDKAATTKTNCTTNSGRTPEGFMVDDATLKSPISCNCHLSDFSASEICVCAAGYLATVLPLDLFL